MLLIRALALGLAISDLAASSLSFSSSSYHNRMTQNFLETLIKSEVNNDNDNDKGNNNNNNNNGNNNNALQNEYHISLHSNMSYQLNSNERLKKEINNNNDDNPVNNITTTVTDAIIGNRSKPSHDNNIRNNKSPHHHASNNNNSNNSNINNETYGVSIFDDWPIQPCAIWERSNYLYYQLGNAFFFLAFLGPRNRFGELWQRTFFVIGCLFIGIYGYFIKCIADIMIWAGISLAVNSVYLIIALCRLMPLRFEKQFEEIYISLFQPLRVSRRQFKNVLSCMRVVRSLKYQEFYATEKVTKVDSLSLVLSGKLVVSQNHRALHIVFPHQFLDSPEWFGVSTDDYFQVSIMAMEDSKVLIWHRDKLRLSIMTDVFLQTVFDHILGRDVVKKLMQVTQVSETIASNGFLPMGCYDDNESKPMLATKKIIESNALTALISRQLQTGDINSWRLGRIEETDHETPV